MNLLEVRVLLIFIFLDYFTGVLVAISEKKLNSTIGRRGISVSYTHLDVYKRQGGFLTRLAS